MNWEKRVSRRDLLKGVAGTALLYPALQIATNLDEVVTAVEAAKGHKIPEHLPKTAQELDDLLEQVLPEQVLKEVWEKHFKGRESLMPYSAWSDQVNLGEGLKKGIGIGNYMAKLAMYCYSEEAKKIEEDFSKFFRNFIDQFHTLSDIAGLDFFVLSTSLKVSGENHEGRDPRVNANIDKRQMEMAIPRVFGLSNKLLEGVSSDGWILNDLNFVGDRIGINIAQKMGLPKMGMGHYDSIRLDGPETTGLMDFEAEVKADAYMHANDELKEKFSSQFPDVEAQYKKAIESRKVVEIARSNLQESANQYIANYGKSLQVFADGEPVALEAIGIGKNGFDEWQLVNYTQAWLSAVQAPDNPSLVVGTVIESMKESARNNLSKFYMTLMSQQIQNPRFLPFLIDQAKSKNASYEVSQLEEMLNLLGVFEAKVRDFRVDRLKIASKENPYDFNAYFEQITSVMITKMLSDKAGGFDPNNDNDVLVNTYRTILIREMSPPPTQVNSSFCKNHTIDCPYASEETLVVFDKFVSLLLESHLITKPPEGDIIPTIQTINSLQYARNAYRIFRSDISKTQWDEVMNFMDRDFDARLYWNRNNDIKRWTEKDIEDLFDGFSSLLIQKGLLKRSPEQDIPAFYDVLINFLYGDLALLDMPDYLSKSQPPSCAVSMEEANSAKIIDATRQLSEKGNSLGIDIVGERASNTWRGADGFFYMAYQRGILKWDGRSVSLLNTLDLMSDLGLDEGLDKGIFGVQIDHIDDLFKMRLENFKTPGALFEGSKDNFKIPEKIRQYADSIRKKVEIGAFTSFGTNYGPYTVYRTQTVAIQEWTQGQHKGLIQLVLVGDAAKKAGLVPPEVIHPNSKPGEYLTYKEQKMIVDFFNTLVRPKLLVKVIEEDREITKYALGWETYPPANRAQGIVGRVVDKILEEKNKAENTKSISSNSLKVR